jgi:phospholipid transport system substrate-binding protein
MRNVLRSLALSVGLFLFSSMAFAGPATDVVKSKQTALFDLLRGGGGDQKVAAILDEMLDYDTFSKDSLGKEWEARSDEEKKEFSELLKQLVRKSYERNLKKTLDFDVEYVSETPKGGAVLVKTKAKSKKNEKEEPLEIAYKLAEQGGQWRVQDIITEGVSMVGSYRGQFTKIIKKDGFPALIKKMKDKLAKGDVLARGPGPPATELRRCGGEGGASRAPWRG